MMSPKTKVQGIKINEGGSNLPENRRQELSLGDKGKRKKHMSRKGIAIDADFSKP